MKTSLLFSETYERLWNKTIKINDLLPVGKEEAPIIEKSYNKSNYPHVVQLPKTFSCDKLLQDFLTSRLKLEEAEKSVFEYRSSFFIEATSTEILYMLEELGFTKNTYQAYALRWPGSAELLPAIKGYTRECLNEIGKHFRQLYTVAQSGWCSKPHIDNENMAWHGFKVHLPINTDGYIGYVCYDKKIRIYRLSPGIPYFCNTSIPHFGINPLKVEKISLNFQIASDKSLFEGAKIEPEKDNNKLKKHIPWIEELYQNYERNYRLLSKKI